MSEINLLREYVEVDREKLALLHGLERKREMHMLCSKSFEMMGDAYDEDMQEAPEMDDFAPLDNFECNERAAEPSPSKYCPKCGLKFGEDENFCPECLVTLKGISDEIDVKSISTDPDMEYVKGNDSDDILTEENISLINSFDFTIEDFNMVLHSIRAQAFQNLDDMIRGNGLSLDELDALDKVILFAKSFVHVEYKSYGEQLGYFEFDRIYVDDRQRKSLQITTLIHELTHFLIKEILTRTVCEILDCTKNSHIEAVITYILTYSKFNNLIDEYAAHSVEGRFTIFGYQDYSSFTALQDDLDSQHVDIAKTIGNSFSIYINDLMEGFLDWDVREEIKEQFLSDTIEGPNYGQLRFESCNKLSDEGFLKAIWLTLSDGFMNADGELIAEYEGRFADE